MKENKLTYGVLLTRCQPLHQGHINVIEQILKENDRCLIVIGSADKEGTRRNPFEIDERRNLYLSLKDYLKTDRLCFMVLDDWSTDSDIPYESSVGSDNDDYGSVNSEWGYWLYYNIVNVIKRKDFALYYNDNPLIIENWFSRYIRNRINIRSCRRTKWSSSDVRNAMSSNNIKYLKNAMPYIDKDKIECLCLKYQSIIKKGEKYVTKNN